jgi:murein DD-endopeptidase MepM/ murein hydrolase activator NlpD
MRRRWYTGAVPRQSRRRRPSWILALALFGAGLLGFGALANGPDFLTVALVPAADVAGAGAVAGAVAPDRTAEPAAAPVAVRTPRPVAARGPIVDVPPDSFRPLAPHALRDYHWPLRKGRLTLGFQHTPWGSRVVDGERFHDGIDLATFCGDRVVAAHDGVVLAAGRHFDDEVGWVGSLERYYDRLDRKHLWQQLPIAIVVDDGNGYRSIYAHFSKIVVKKGERVEAGQLIGYEGRTGRASGCHLHYGLFSPIETDTFRIHPDTVKRMKVPRYQVARIDPLRVLPPRRGFPEPNVLPAADPGH